MRKLTDCDDVISIFNRETIGVVKELQIQDQDEVNILC